jgi:ribonuclease P protein component
MRNNFTKKERLCSLKEIENLVKKGKSFYCFPFKVISILQPTNIQENTMSEELSAEENVNSIVVSVPKRNFKRAVKRNLLKRRIRESYRLNKHILPIPENGKINILFVYIAKEILEYDNIERKMKDILKTLSNEHQC